VTDLDDIIARVRRMPELAKRAAPDVARAVEDELARTIAAGTTPDGKPWQATKDGARPLANAANAVAVAAVGTTIHIRVTGPEARHHLGRAKGGVVREIIPTNGIPAPMGAAIRDAITEHFHKVANGH
jgi:hypothetical protein